MSSKENSRSRVSAHSLHSCRRSYNLSHRPTLLPDVPAAQGYAAALQRKQAAAAASNNDPLPRVAALAPQRCKQSRSPLRASFG
jgi:hypothetical protein